MGEMPYLSALINPWKVEERVVKKGGVKDLSAIPLLCPSVVYLPAFFETDPCALLMRYLPLYS